MDKTPEESDAQNFSGFGEICSLCKNQSDKERGGLIITRCKKAGFTRHTRGKDGQQESYTVMTDLTKYDDGSETCSDYLATHEGEVSDDRSAKSRRISNDSY